MNTLADLFPSLLHSLGSVSERNSLGIEQSEAGREAVLLIDGLGSEQLVEYSTDAPLLSSLPNFAPFSANFPSTTATSLASLGVGVEPNVHGMFGYSVAVPESGNPPRILNALKWDDRVDPISWQPTATAFERAAQAGITTASVASTQYQNSGLTQAALRGSQYFGVEKRGSFIEQAALAMRHAQLGYLYLNDLDVIGHAKGVGSPEWLKVLTTLDSLVEELLTSLPAGTRLWITGDHGMINATENLDMAQLVHLDQVVIAGEGRARHIYCQNPDQIAVLWAEQLGDQVQILTRQEAIAAGWFGGPVSERLGSRIGDLLLLPTGGRVLINPERRKEGQMVGHHGGRTSAETGVPLRVAYSKAP